MPSGTLAPWWSSQFLDSNGAPLSGGTVKTFEAGTSTPLATYSDAGLTVSNGLTFTLTSGGFPQVANVEVGVYLLPRAYKFELYNSAGVLVRTRDNVYASQPAGSVNLEVDGVAGEALAANDLCYESDGSNSLTAGRWYKADADVGFYAGIFPNLAFATATIASGATGTFRRGGTMDGFSALVAGTTYYVSTTTGGLTATAPTNARSVGVASSATTLVIDLSPRWVDRIADLNICDGRLTLTSGTPVTTSDVSAATTLYFTPYKGNRIALFDGTSQWKVYPFAELSITLAALTASRPYDVWVYDNSGTLALELTAWTNTTTRATALTTQNGVYVKTGATSRRYLGTICINAAGGQTDDTYAKRLVWNYYHRVARPMRVLEATDSWTYTTATWRQANASVANQLAIVVGVAEVPIRVQVTAQGTNDNAGVQLRVGIGEDSTTAPASGSVRPRLGVPGVNYNIQLISLYETFPAVGYHVYAWLEYSAAGVGTTTWVGDSGATDTNQTGITGQIDG